MGALACGTTTVGTPTADVNGVVAQTMAAYTVEALLTQAAVPPETPSATPSLTPSPMAITPTSAPEEVAPNPLPVAYTGVILNNGECFNFDDGAVSVPDQRCDVWLQQSGLFRQMNGAQLSGYNVSYNPPTRSRCVSAKFDPTDLAIQTDLYMCFHSDEGQVGFIVAREYLGNAPYTGIVFDYWIFR